MRTYRITYNSLVREVFAFSEEFAIDEFIEFLGYKDYDEFSLYNKGGSMTIEVIETKDGLTERGEFR